ncbi:hypothetical protein D9611_000494 [Ephemerocybe angulata]|uniref:Uncharacterized protein n=1 Tax=Ephemerocybe angulata TaxID=980116 RepID=A0A8H5F7H6_9AGAR|nr:hypothetical protein D9611_000494 [Tulosesus angulatus]
MEKESSVISQKSVSPPLEMEEVPVVTQQERPITPSVPSSAVEELPEELMWAILADPSLEKADLLACARSTRLLNKIAVQRLLRDDGIPEPASYCEIRLGHNPMVEIDSLVALMHSVHITRLKDVTFSFSRFTYKALVPALRRVLRCVRKIRAEEVTLLSGTLYPPSTENYVKEIGPVFEELLNEIIERSSKKIRLIGSDGIMGGLYTFQSLDQVPALDDDDAVASPKEGGNPPQIVGVADGVKEVGGYSAPQLRESEDIPMQDVNTPCEGISMRDELAILHENDIKSEKPSVLSKDTIEVGRLDVTMSSGDISQTDMTVPEENTLEKDKPDNSDEVAQEEVATSISNNTGTSDKGGPDDSSKDTMKNVNGATSDEDTIAQDDLRYLPTEANPARYAIKCSAKALNQTQLTHANLDNLDFLRPPFSQWMFGILRASPMQSLSFSFSRFTSDLEETNFCLKRLASVLPGVNRLYLYDIIATDSIPILFKWINMFPSLQHLQIEPRVMIDYADVPESTHTSVLGPYTFAPKLKSVDAPYQFLEYLFDEAQRANASGTLSEAKIPAIHTRASDTCGGDPKSTKPAPESMNEPSSSSPSPGSLFPSLETVRMDAFCKNGDRLDVPALANAVRSIKPVVLPSIPSELAPVGTDLPSHEYQTPDAKQVTIAVDIKFDSRFLGLTPSPSHTGIPGEVNRHPMEAHLEALADVEEVRLSLPGDRDDIMQGTFNSKIMDVMSLFLGLKTLKLVETVKGPLNPTEQEEMRSVFVTDFKQRYPLINRVDVVYL